MPLSSSDKRKLLEKARGIRKDIVEITAWSGGAHIGGGLSVTDVLTYLYFHEMNIRTGAPEWEDRDRLILSKGHSAVAYTAVLARRHATGNVSTPLCKNLQNSRVTKRS